IIGSVAVVVIVLTVLVDRANGRTPGASPTATVPQRVQAQATASATIVAASATATPLPPTTVPTPATPTATPHPLVWRTVQHFTGSADSNTATFTVNASEWRLVWTCQKANALGGSFIVYLNRASGDYVDLVALASDNAGDTIYEHESGQFFLEVNTY